MLPQNQGQYYGQNQQYQYYENQQPQPAQYQYYPQHQPYQQQPMINNPYPNPYEVQQVEQIYVKENQPSQGVNQSSMVIAAVPLSNIKHETHSHHPTQIVCPNCNQMITTWIKYEIGAGTWAMVLFFFCIFWPIMCLPFCCQSMQDVVHYCPICNGYCGRKKFLC